MSEVMDAIAVILLGLVALMLIAGLVMGFMLMIKEKRK